MGKFHRKGVDIMRGKSRERVHQFSDIGGACPVTGNKHRYPLNLLDWLGGEGGRGGGGEAKKFPQ